MHNLAEKRQYVQAYLEYGYVLKVEDETYFVKSLAGIISCKKALSCLLSPELGDKVLISVESDENNYILSVLERSFKKNNKYKLKFNGQVDFNVKNGKLNFSSDENIDFAAENKLNLISKEIAINADKGDVTINEMSFVGNIFKSQLKFVKIIAETAENVFYELTQRLGSCFRYVQDQEEIQTGSTRYLVEDELTMHGKTLNHIAQEDVKIDGKQIHLG